MAYRFGPGGTAGIGYTEIFPILKEKGLDAMEVEFTYGVRMSNTQAEQLGKEAAESGISLSIHAPYYINLASPEKEKRDASMKRILDSCERGHKMGATHIVFHPGFYQGRDEEETYQTIRSKIAELQDVLKKKGWQTILAPETTGKPTQFGSLEESLRLAKETGCSLTIDFAHLLARNAGKIDYQEVFGKIAGIRHIHAHFSGIEWTAKGEKKHRLTVKEDILPLAKAAKGFSGDITFINESPDPITDALLMKEIFDGLL